MVIYRIDRLGGDIVNLINEEGDIVIVQCNLCKKEFVIKKEKCLKTDEGYEVNEKIRCDTCGLEDNSIIDYKKILIKYNKSEKEINLQTFKEEQKLQEEKQKEKRRFGEQKNKMEQEREKKAYNRTCLIGSFILLFACLFGTARGMKQSVFIIFIDNPAKGLSYVIIVVFSTVITYLICRFFSSRKDK